MRETNTHIYFWGGWPSNFCPVNFMHKGIHFKSSEQAFMYLKALAFKDNESASQIIKASTPKEAKKLGRKVKNFDDAVWAQIRFEAMVLVLISKFYHQELRQNLLNTGNKVLVEASPYDAIWGVKIAAEDDAILDEANWKGQNLLGKALMEVRQYYQTGMCMDGNICAK